MWTPEKIEDIERLKLTRADRDEMSRHYFGMTYAQHLDRKVSAGLEAEQLARWRMLSGDHAGPAEDDFAGLMGLGEQQRLPSVAGKPHTASAYADWVFRLSHGAGYMGSAASRQEGTDYHAKLARLRKRLAVPRHSLWKCIHNGLHEEPETRVISPLSISGIPMRGSPDLVFENAGLRTILIVEVKFSRREIRQPGWPNVMAQLWCYSQIDEYRRRAKKILLRAELYGLEELSHRFDNAQHTSWLGRRHTWCYDAKSAAFNAWNERLFGLYRGLRETDGAVG